MSVVASAASNGNGTHAPSHGDSRASVSLSELRELCTKSLKVLGYPDDEVKVLLEVRACMGTAEACYQHNNTQL